MRRLRYRQSTFQPRRGEIEKDTVQKRQLSNSPDFCFEAFDYLADNKTNYEAHRINPIIGTIY